MGILKIFWALGLVKGLLNADFRTSLVKALLQEWISCLIQLRGGLSLENLIHFQNHWLITNLSFFFIDQTILAANQVGSLCHLIILPILLELVLQSVGWQALIFEIFYLIHRSISKTRLPISGKWITHNRRLTLEYILQMIPPRLFLTIFPGSLIQALTGDQIIGFLCRPWNIRSVAQRTLRVWSRLGVNPFLIILTFFLLNELRICQVGERRWQSLSWESRRCL